MLLVVKLGVFLIKGTALNRSDLRSVNLNTCAMCVIIGAPTAAGDKPGDPTMADKYKNIPPDRFFHLLLLLLEINQNKFEIASKGSNYAQ